MKEILKILPEKLVKEIVHLDNITEIRVRANNKCIVYSDLLEVITEYIPDIQDILDILVKISSNSIYAIQNDINQGFVIIKGGHRVGVCGEVVVENGKIKNIKNVGFLNIRVARQIFGAADKLIDKVVVNNKVRNTLIVSPPGSGKTTILRDLVRQISSKYKVNIGVVDERSEIASVSNGIANLDVGLRTDVMTNVSKKIGIEMLVRSMGLNVIVADEISDLDIDAINYGASTGVSYIYTLHGSSLEDVYKRSGIKKMIDEGLFDLIVVISFPGKIDKIIEVGGDK